MDLRLNQGSLRAIRSSDRPIPAPLIRSPDRRSPDSTSPDHPIGPIIRLLILFFETHATSLDNEQGIASGHFDAALSETGRAQARELGERCRDVPLDAVFCSDLARAVDTARLAFESRGVPIIVDARLRECDYGSWTRRRSSDIEAQRLQHVDEPFSNGESYRQVVARVGAWLADVRAAHSNSHILVVGHRATWYALEHLLRGRPLDDVVAAPWHWQPGWTYGVGEPTERAPS